MALKKSFLMFVLAGACAASKARGASFTWTGNGGDNNWSTGLNWAGGAAPAKDGTANIFMVGITRLAPVVDVPWNIQSINFNSGSAYTMSGSALTVGAGGVSVGASLGSTSDETINTALILTADQPRASKIAVGGSIDTGGHVITFSQPGTGILSGIISGAGGIIINSNSATMALSGTNTYSGGTTIAAGTANVTADANLGAASGVVQISSGGAIPFSALQALTRQLTLTQAVTIGVFGSSGSGTIPITPGFTGPGPLLITGSVIYLKGSSNPTGGITVSSGTVQFDTTSYQGNVVLPTLSCFVQFDQTFNGTFAGNISGGGEMNVFGTGVVTLTGNNTFKSDTQIFDGTLEVVGTASTALSASSRIVFKGGGVIQIAGGGTFTRPEGTGLIWSGSGGFAARNGKLIVNLGGAGAAYTISSIAALTFGSPNADSPVEFQNPITLTKGFNITVNSGAGGDYAEISAPISGPAIYILGKNGTGLLKLTATNTFLGPLVISAGVVQAAAGVGLPSNGSLQFTGGVWLAVGPTDFDRPLGTTPGTVIWSGAPANVGGGFAASGGTLRVNIGGAGATMTWGTTTAAGFVGPGCPLMFGAPQADSQTIFVNPINLGQQANREIRVDQGLGGDFATPLGAVSGTSALVKTGSGLLELAGANTNTGVTNIIQGSLQVDTILPSTLVIVQGNCSLGGKGSLAGVIVLNAGVDAQSRGAVNLVDGSVGTMTLTDPTSSDNTLTVGASTGLASLLKFEVGADSDKILLTNGKLFVDQGGGIISITPIGGFQPGIYDLIEFQAGQATGLDNLTLENAHLNGLTLSLQQTDTALQLVVVPEPGSLLIASVGAGMLLSGRRRRQLRSKKSFNCHFPS